MRPGVSMDLVRWRRLEAILDLALDLPLEERNTLLDEACAGDSSLRADVEAFLAADAGAGSFLGLPAGEYAPNLLVEAVGEEESGGDLAGLQLGPYLLLCEIGSGGMGTVYEAEDKRLGRRIAIKILPLEYCRDHKAKERFLREARAASAVDHPNLCTVYDVGESEGRLYIVLALYEGETLRERIRRGPLSPPEAQEVAIQVARGLARAHEAGIIHRDIKPANVMLTRRGEAKILDFGIARLEGDEVSLTRTGASVGTPAYMSPEQARGELVDARTDVWSLGVILYEMVAGRRPFGGESIEVVVSAILTQKPESLERARPEVPPELAQVIDRALAKDPAERYASAAELLAELESGRVSSALPVFPRRHRLKALRWSLLAAALITAGVLLLLIRGWQPWRAVAEPPRRVAVLRPIVKSSENNPELGFVASEVVEASLSTLVSLEGLQALDPPERGEESGSETEKLRTADADEALLPLLDCQANWCQVRFRLLQEPGGAVLATSGPFEAQTGIENAFELARAVQLHLQQIFPDHKPRPESGVAQVKARDYSAYVKLERRVDGGERLGVAELDQLDALLRSSPGLVGAYRLAAEATRLQGALERALNYAAQAEELAPRDPRPMITRLQVEVQANQLVAARETLRRLENLAPGDARVLSAKADLLAARGELEAALELRKKVAQRRPTWLNVLELARLEFRLGASESARRRLGNLLEKQPDNQYVRDHLAALEACFGDLKRAAALYEELIRTRPARPFYSNLGFVYFLLGDYSGGIAAYRQALALEPAHILTRFNLADALEAQGDLAEARDLYRTLEKELAGSSTPLDAHDRMLHAQCLARLGRRVAAAHLADDVLKQRPEDVQVLYYAAHLYAFLGERLSALYYMELALKKGLRREWFTVPEFRSFKEDPDFQALLGSSAVPK